LLIARRKLALFKSSFGNRNNLDLRKLFLQTRQELLRIADFSSGKNEFAN